KLLGRCGFSHRHCVAGRTRGHSRATGFRKRATHCLQQSLPAVFYGSTLLTNRTVHAECRAGRLLYFDGHERRRQWKRRDHYVRSHPERSTSGSRTPAGKRAGADPLAAQEYAQGKSDWENSIEVARAGRLCDAAQVIRLSASFRTKDRKQMAIDIAEVRRPVRGSHGARLAEKNHSSSLKFFLRATHVVHLKYNFSRAGKLRQRASHAGIEPEHDRTRVEQSQARFLHD